MKTDHKIGENRQRHLCTYNAFLFVQFLSVRPYITPTTRPISILSTVLERSHQVKMKIYVERKSAERKKIGKMVVTVDEAYGGTRSASCK